MTTSTIGRAGRLGLAAAAIAAVIVVGVNAAAAETTTGATAAPCALPPPDPVTDANLVAAGLATVDFIDCVLAMPEVTEGPVDGLGHEEVIDDEVVEFVSTVDDQKPPPANDREEIADLKLLIDKNLAQIETLKRQRAAALRRVDEETTLLAKARTRDEAIRRDLRAVSAEIQRIVDLVRRGQRLSAEDSFRYQLLVTALPKFRDELEGTAYDIYAHGQRARYFQSEADGYSRLIAERQTFIDQLRARLP